MSDLQIGGLFTPATIRGAAGQLTSAVKTISKEVFAADDVPADFESDWDQFSQEYTAWTSANLGFFSTILNSTRDDLNSFIERYGALRTRWQVIDAQTSAESFNVTSDTVAGALDEATSAISQSVTKVGLSLAVVGGILLVLWVLFKRSK